MGCEEQTNVKSDTAEDSQANYGTFPRMPLNMIFYCMSIIRVVFPNSYRGMEVCFQGLSSIPQINK